MASLCDVMHGILVHDDCGTLYGPMPWADNPPSRATLPIAERLDAIMAACDAPLARARPVTERVVGTCRDFALMLCAMLRHQGTPARVRCGFATYFTPGFFEDHWVCEYWRADEERWALADAQLDEAHRRYWSVDFDPADIPAERFLFAWQAWRAFRNGVAESHFGQEQISGAWFLRVNLARDLLSLHKHETSPRASWRELRPEDKVMNLGAIADCEQMARQAKNIARERSSSSALPAPFWLARDGAP